MTKCVYEEDEQRRRDLRHGMEITPLLTGNSFADHPGNLRAGHLAYMARSPVCEINPLCNCSAKGFCPRRICVIIFGMAYQSPRSTSQFWEERAQAFAHTDKEGWAAVCSSAAHLCTSIASYAGARKRAFSRLLAKAAFRQGDPALDIGCGTGRWTRALADAGLQVSGYDVSTSMVARAREISPHLKFDVASATSPLLDAASVQVAASVYPVIHHLEPHDQDAAVAELARVVRPGGSPLVIALLDTIPSGAWCYNRSRKDWLRLFHTPASSRAWS